MGVAIVRIAILVREPEIIAWLCLYLLTASCAADLMLRDAREVTSGRQYSVIALCALLWPLVALGFVAWWCVRLLLRRRVS